MTLPFRPLRHWLDAALGLDERARRHPRVFRDFAAALSRLARGTSGRAGSKRTAA